MKAPSPLLGFNNNVRHKGRVFHIQTEDSGIRRPHIITHLFADGGRILKTVKTSYAEHVGDDAVGDIVRGMMKEQHKAMFIALRGGDFDAVFDELPSSMPAGSASIPPPATQKVAAEPPPPPAPVASVAPPPIDDEETLASGAPPSKRKASRPELHLDPSSLRGANLRDHAAAGGSIFETGPLAERASRDVDGAVVRAPRHAPLPSFQEIQDLPPPPASVLATKKGGASATYRDVRSRPPPPPNARRSSIPPRMDDAPKSGASGSGRYAPVRPASIFGSGPALPAAGASIFGEELISEKSLDEVILSYLAEDLDAPASKK